MHKNSLLCLFICDTLSMAPAVQILASALLFSFGLIAPESVQTMPGLGFTSSLLSVTTLALGSLMAASFVISRLLSWYINR